MAIADRSGLPLAVCISSASPHEVTLVEEVLDNRFIEEAPVRLIGDKAYDSDPLDKLILDEFATVLIAPHRSNRTKPKTQDGRALRRYKRRWQIERLFAWFHNFRRIVVRYDWYEQNFLGFVQLGCILILLRHL
jgi:transposase